MDALQELVEIEAIKRLKARYFRSIDTHDWEAFGAVFAPQAEFDVRDDVGPETGFLTGRQQIVDFVRAAVGTARTIHHGHMPEIDLEAPDRARGIWAMYDYVEFAASPDAAGARSGLHGYGHYHETYVKHAGAWQIASLRLARLRIDPLA